ncbi:MAG: hypothetical protein MJE68_01790 [Proteobacteria bacterium]|nr:hypothetical protein [Pseudomonadota bacterium]
MDPGLSPNPGGGYSTRLIPPSSVSSVIYTVPKERGGAGWARIGHRTRMREYKYSRTCRPEWRPRRSRGGLSSKHNRLFFSRG